MVFNHSLFLFLYIMASKQQNTILLSTAFLGTIEYFYYLNMADSVIVEQHETWPKQTYRNRTVIVTDKSRLPLVVPVKKINGNYTKTMDVTVLYHEEWHVKHWRSIQTAYQNSPFFLYYSDVVKEILYSKIESLIELNALLTKAVIKMIGIKTDIRFSNEFVKVAKDNTFDLRYKLSPKLSTTISEFPEYTQVFFDKQPFISNASILDLIFCVGPESKNYLEKLTHIS